MHDFKIGDYVEVVDDTSNNVITKGERATVTLPHGWRSGNDNMLTVLWDDTKKGRPDQSQFYSYRFKLIKTTGIIKTKQTTVVEVEVKVVAGMMFKYGSDSSLYFVNDKFQLINVTNQNYYVWQPDAREFDFDHKWSLVNV